MYDDIGYYDLDYDDPEDDDDCKDDDCSCSGWLYPDAACPSHGVLAALRAGGFFV